MVTVHDQPDCMIGPAGTGMPVPVGDEPEACLCNALPGRGHGHGALNEVRVADGSRWAACTSDWRRPDADCITQTLDSDNFNLDSTHEASQVRNKEMNTGEHRLQADVEQQGWETPPHKSGPPAWLREGLARALEAGGPERRPQRP